MSSTDFLRRASLNWFDRMLVAPLNNRYCKLMLRSSTAIKDEQRRQVLISRFLVHPYSYFRFFWDVIMVVVLMGTMIVLPIHVSFFPESSDPLHALWHYVTDALFFIDIIVNFNTGYVAKKTGQVILDRRKICLHYVWSWFIMDLVSSIPVDYIVVGIEMSGKSLSASTYKFIRSAKVVALLRLFRLSRLLRYIHQLEELLDVDEATLRIINLSFILSMVFHWNGCLQYFVIHMQGYPMDSWVVRSGIVNKTVSQRYTASLFKAVSQMLGAGYGLVTPLTDTDMWLSISSMVLGLICCGLWIGSLYYHVASFNQSGRLYSEKIKVVKEYMRQIHLPDVVRNRVLTHYEFKYIGKLFDEDDLVGEQSHALRMDILRHTCRRLVQNVPIFSAIDGSIVDEILTCLHREVFVKDDLIVEADTIGRCMYFIEHGMVAVEIPSNERLIEATPTVRRKYLSDGDYFGAISLVFDTKRMCTVRAIEHCDLYRLDKHEFEHILKPYPEIYEMIRRETKTRLDLYSTDGYDLNNNDRFNVIETWIDDLRQHEKDGE
ncbi:HCN2 (predicted) [Pycnogonum litorale]